MAKSDKSNKMMVIKNQLHGIFWCMLNWSVKIYYFDVFNFFYN